MREYTDGATAIARGALRAGCNFFAGYPITPMTAILVHMVNALPTVGGVAVQAEDEIAAISLWPLPRHAIQSAAAGVERVIVPELNLGQYRQEIERLLPTREVVGIHRVDGELITPEEILDKACF